MHTHKLAQLWTYTQTGRRKETQFRGASSLSKADSRGLWTGITGMNCKPWLPQGCCSMCWHSLDWDLHAHLVPPIHTVVKIAESTRFASNTKKTDLRRTPSVLELMGLCCNWGVTFFWVMYLYWKIRDREQRGIALLLVSWRTDPLDKHVKRKKKKRKKKGQTVQM